MHCALKRYNKLYSEEGGLVPPNWVKSAFQAHTFSDEDEDYEAFYLRVVEQMESALKELTYSATRNEKAIKASKVAPAKLTTAHCEAVWSVMIRAVARNNFEGLQFCEEMLVHHAGILLGCSVSEYKLALVIMLTEPKTPDFLHRLCEQCSAGKVNASSVASELINSYMSVHHLFERYWKIVWNALSFSLAWREAAKIRDRVTISSHLVLPTEGESVRALVSLLHAYKISIPRHQRARICR